MDAITATPEIVGPAADERAEGASRPAAIAPILRLDASTVSALLDGFHDPALLAEGRVNILALDAIRDRLGPRWGLRQELVYDHVQEAVERRLGPAAVSIRVAETLFAVVQPDTDRLTAQALCLRCLRDIHHHFLGQVVVADLTLHEVSRITPEGLFGSRVDMAALAAAEAGLQAPAIPSRSWTPEEPRPPFERWTAFVAQGSEPQPPPDAARSWAPAQPRGGGVDKWTPFVAADGRTVRASCTLEPVLRLGSSTCVGYRLGRHVVELPSELPLSSLEQQNLSRADIARIDYATLARGLDRLATEGGGERSPALMVPVSFVTLSNLRTREVFIRLLGDARRHVRHGLICEISDLEGVPVGALLAAIGLIRPFCIRVVGSIDGMPAASARTLREVGFHGLTAECPRNLGDAEFIGWLKEVRRSSRPVSRNVVACRVEGMRRAGMASQAGMSHATLTTDAARTVVVN